MDFDLRQVKECFRDTIRHRMRADNPASYGDILNDVTAGPKHVSIAGAAVNMQMLGTRVQWQDSRMK